MVNFSNGYKNSVIWITGLSGSGKTTLVKALMPNLAEKSIMLDGDELRGVLNVSNYGFDYESRKSLAFTYARLARLLALQGFTVVVSTISLFHELHAWNRENLPNYLEVFLDISENIRRDRDPKGLYAAEKAGQEKQMAGIGTVAEFPKNPDIRISENVKLDEMVKIVLEKILGNES